MQAGLRYCLKFVTLSIIFKLVSVAMLVSVSYNLSVIIDWPLWTTTGAQRLILVTLPLCRIARGTLETSVASKFSNSSENGVEVSS